MTTATYTLNINVQSIEEAAEKGVMTHMLTERTERHFCQCYACKQKTTIDFEVQVWEFAWYNARTGQIVWEPRTTYTLDGKAVKSTYIAQCPRCGADKPKRARLNPHKVQHDPNHVCDNRCQSATSDNCTCSCNGANHGIKHRAQGGLWS